MNHNPSIWDNPIAEMALRLAIADKWSARKCAWRISEIAGRPVTRNACIGAARRRSMSFMSLDVGKYPRRPKLAPVAAPKPKRRSPKFILQAKPIALPEEPPMSVDFLGVTFWQLEKGQCKFAHGDGPYIFCGQPVSGETSWCAYHNAICHVGGSNVVHSAAHPGSLQNSAGCTAGGNKGSKVSG